MKKYHLLITTVGDKFVEGFLDDDMDVVIKKTAQYNIEELSNKSVVFYTLFIYGKKADQANWEKFQSKYNKYEKILRRMKSLNKDFEC